MVATSHEPRHRVEGRCSLYGLLNRVYVHGSGWSLCLRVLELLVFPLFPESEYAGGALKSGLRVIQRFSSTL